MTGYPNKLSTVAVHKNTALGPSVRTHPTSTECSLPSLRRFAFRSHTRGALTFLAAITFITGQAEAEERVDLVDASASVLARLRLAVVYICGEEREA